MKKFLLLTIVLGSTAAASAQTTSATGGDCRLTAAQAPAIRGLRLGMTIDQALGVFPGAQADSDLRARLARDNFGAQFVGVEPSKYESKEKFAGVGSVNLAFLDGRMTSFQVTYIGPEWKNEEQFAAKVAETLGLPGVSSWKPGQNVLQLTCDGFRIAVQTIGLNVIYMEDLRVDVAKVIGDRAEVPKDQARRAFKP